MILHICPPETKFVSSLVDRFELVKPGFNRCVIIVSSHHKNSNTGISNNLIDYRGPLNTEIIRKISGSAYDGIVVHTLNDDILDLALNLLQVFPVIWRSWGTDLHDILYPGLDLLLPYTRQLVYGKSIFHKIENNFLRPVYHTFSGKAEDYKKRVLKKIEFLRSVRVISTATRTEFNLLRQAIPDLKATFMPLNYRSLDLEKLPGLRKTNEDNKIMVGHSSYPYHNHTDIFYQLNNNSFKGSISVPVSYGDYKYRKKIINKGKKYFDNRISFLTEFLGLEDYLELLNKHDSFILNSKVQSGGGNVIFFLYQGSKVYLREENPAFQDYKECGIKLFDIERDLRNSNMLSEDISSQDKKVNREIIETLYNSKREKENVINVFQAFSVKVKTLNSKVIIR